MWRVFYPLGMHFMISQIVGSAALLYLGRKYGNGMQLYYQYAILLTGITGLIVIIPALFFYRRDAAARLACGVIRPAAGRRLTVWEGIWLLFIGAGFAQFVNIFMAYLQEILGTTVYQETMDRITEGKGLFMMVLWMGIIAPAAEELVFRWLLFLRLRDYMRLPIAALLSGLIFGIYHGNLIQAVYASILGFLFAYLLEASGSLMGCIFLHVGANSWSLLFPEVGYRTADTQAVYLLWAVLIVLFVVMVKGWRYFLEKWRRRGFRCV